jgi:hypothetical protein
MMRYLYLATVGALAILAPCAAFGQSSASMTATKTNRSVNASLPIPPGIYIPVANLGNACLVEQLNPLMFGTVGAVLRVNFDSPIASASGETDDVISSWDFSIDVRQKTGPWLGFAAFRGANWDLPKLIVNQAGLADIFVAYNSHDADDLQFQTPAGLRQIFRSDLPAVGGGLVTLDSDFHLGALGFPRIGVECRERGIDWLCKSNAGNDPARPAKNAIGRGYEVVVWAVIDAGNYDNILQYIFRDDGSVGFRLGTSGSIDRGRVVYDPPGSLVGEAHMHNALWRLSTSLFGTDSNRVYVTQHQETAGAATDTEIPITEEGFVDFKSTAFTTILIQNTVLKNGRGHLMGYEVVPFGRLGTARHEELWTGHDFWITVDNPGENGDGNPPDNWRSNFHPPDETMLRYAANTEPMNVDMTPVIWYRSSILHHPSDSDLAGDGTVGITSIHWAGFDFHPHNAFDFNPMTNGLGYCE